MLGSEAARNLICFPFECRVAKLPIGSNCSWESMGIDGNRLLDCSMLAAGLGLVLVAGLSLAGLTSTLVAALHVGSERVLAGFDALSGVSRALTGLRRTARDFLGLPKTA